MTVLQEYEKDTRHVVLFLLPLVYQEVYYIYINHQGLHKKFFE